PSISVWRTRRGTGRTATRARRWSCCSGCWSGSRSRRSGGGRRSRRCWSGARRVGVGARRCRGRWTRREKGQGVGKGDGGAMKEGEAVQFPEVASDLPLRRTRTLGKCRLHALEAGLQRLDGGAMFGVVPKPLWQKRIPADGRNRIPLALRCLLIETPDALVLVDNGVGNKEDAKFRDIYGVDNAGSPTRLEDALRDAGFTPEDVDIVINTHLHFDHAGGNTYRDAEGAIRLSFPRARYVVQAGEWEWAHSGNERVRASYLPHNFDPVHAAGRFEFVSGEHEVVPGVRRS